MVLLLEANETDTLQLGQDRIGKCTYRNDVWSGSDYALWVMVIIVIEITINIVNIISDDQKSVFY